MGRIGYYRKIGDQAQRDLCTWDHAEWLQLILDSDLRPILQMHPARSRRNSVRRRCPRPDALVVPALVPVLVRAERARFCIMPAPVKPLTEMHDTTPFMCMHMRACGRGIERNPPSRTTASGHAHCATRAASGERRGHSTPHTQLQRTSVCEICIKVALLEIYRTLSCSFQVAPFR